VDKPAKQWSEDVTTDWPPDSANAELAQFADTLKSALPQLPDAALARIQQTMRLELDHQAARKRMFRTVSAMAAALLVAIVGWRLLDRGERAVAPLTSAPVIDHYAVAPAPVPVQAAARRPLISVQPYESLVGDENVAER